MHMPRQMISGVPIDQTGKISAANMQYIGKTACCVYQISYQYQLLYKY